MNRGEIWSVNLDPTIGAEIKKTRPAVIVSDNSVGLLPLRVIVPVTDWKPHYGAAVWLVKLEPNVMNLLTKLSAVDCFQVRSVSQTRFVKKIGEVSEDEMKEIEQALSAVLHL